MHSVHNSLVILYVMSIYKATESKRQLSPDDDIHSEPHISHCPSIDTRVSGIKEKLDDKYGKLMFVEGEVILMIYEMELQGLAIHLDARDIGMYNDRAILLKIDNDLVMDSLQ
ncbi:hypothetical protein FEM48_Zijuj06G0119000 [Ziziphus jujuba var. spinosa]|uniref:Uncharacterized protein n=1 Tax=Ziziphus jujuba var. spinosa TaxID=714518 RepID=A0A978V951_ZIZJJ|nr:hypothetical protein FEM48_Zijuj06G0119000 [Ziziphus jujuba var. spinosa]